MDIKVDSFKDINLKPICKVPIIVAYDRPYDYPESVILRLYNLDMPTRYICKISDFESVRAYIPDNMTFFKRHIGDDFKIMGTFI